MTSWSRFRRNRTRVASGAVIAAAAAALTAFAISSHGVSVHHSPLNDGGVWVAGSNYGAFAQVNKPVNQFAGSVWLGNQPSDSEKHDLDVVQDGSAVFGLDRTTGKLAVLDNETMGVSAAQRAVVPSGADVVVGGTGPAVVAVLNPADGDLWATHADPDSPTTDLSALSRTSKPLAKVGSNATVAVSDSGTVFAVSPAGILTTVRPTTGGFSTPATTRLGRFSQRPSVTAVGDTPVVLAGHTMYFGPGRTTTVADDSVLQQVGPSAADVLFETPAGLSSVSLGGSAVKQLAKAGSGRDPIAPVLAGGCTYAAWNGAIPSYRTDCPSGNAAGTLAIATQPSALAFRVNRSQVVLNDPTGPVWNVDTDKAIEIDNWTSVLPKSQKRTQHQKNKNLAGSSEAPPVAKPDNLAARPGRTTVLHVLDNDTRPPGDIIAITPNLTGLTDSRAAVEVSADEQTIAITLPPSTSVPVRFSYGITDAHHADPVTAQVTVRPVASGDSAPALCTCAESRNWSVGASSVLDIPVTGDWRDPQGDPVTLTAAQVGTGTASVTSDGDILYTAPDTEPAGKVAIRYTVTDGYGRTAHGLEDVQVLSPDATVGAKPVAQTDVAQAVVGQSVTIQPLANDLPGADPTSQDPSLQLAQVDQVPGASITTDTVHGIVTFTSSVAKTYLVPYSISYGIESATGVMRVDVRNPTRSGGSVVALPDTAVVYGQRPTTVDLLANDYDLRARLLVVQGAAASQPGSGLSMTVVQGRFLHLSLGQSTPSAQPEDVDYTVTDGLNSATGHVTVTELPASDDTPVALPDAVDVRSGDSVLVPVLDNDIDPAGSPLSLEPGSITAPAIGAAFQQGASVRFVAPVVRQATTATFQYVVTNGLHRTTGTGTVTVHPMPASPAEDSPPDPLPLIANVVAGGRVTIPVPTTDVDPDGDSVTFGGITQPGPQLGTVVATTPDHIVYQAFPAEDNAGTDTFGYRVEDRFGRVGEAQVHIAVVPPGTEQAPDAVADTVQAAPGSHLAVNVVANDIVPSGDTARVTLGSADGATIDPANPDVIDVTAPLAGSQRSITYILGDGSGRTDTGTLTVTGVSGWDNAPIAQNDTAKPSSAHATTSTVDVLANDYDPDRSDDLSIVKAFAPGVRLDGANLVLPLRRWAQVVAYEISDGTKSAVAVVYVPAVGAGAPYVKPGAYMSVPVGGRTKPLDINDYLVDPAGKKLTTTFLSDQDAAPAGGLALSSVRGSSVVLSGVGHYVGPASLLLGVTDATAAGEVGKATYFVAVPVQVGHPTPLLRCPTDGQRALYQGGAPVKFDVATTCHLWLPQHTQLGGVQLTSAFGKAVSGVTQSLDRQTHVLTITPGSDARPGETGTVVLGVHGSRQKQTLGFVVEKAPPLSLTAVHVAGRNGKPTTINLAGYATSPIRNPRFSVARCVHTDGMSARCVAHEGSITITPADDARGTITFAATLTDVRGEQSRYVTSLITLDVIGRPAAPTAVRATANRTAGGAVDLTWRSPAFSGGPGDDFIAYYDVRYNGGDKRCLASGCLVSGLTNGRAYTFAVTTVNKANERSATAARSNVATPDKRPDVVRSLTVLPGDRRLVVSWPAPSNGGSRITRYDVAYGASGRQAVATVVRSVRSPSITIGSENDDLYSIKVRADNADGVGPWSPTTQGESAGIPAPVTGITVPAEQATSASDRTYARVTWSHGSDPNGGRLQYYTVYRRQAGGQATVVCQHVSATAAATCSDAVKNDGTRYQYGVSATNSTVPTSAGHASRINGWVSFDATGIPGTPSQVKVFASQDAFRNDSSDQGPQGGSGPGFDGALKVSFVVPAANGSSLKQIEYSLDGGSWQPLSTSGLVQGNKAVGTISSLTNGTGYGVRLRADNGEHQSQATAQAASEYPFGPVPTPTVNADVNGPNVTYSWAGQSNGRDIASWDVTIDGVSHHQTDTTPITVHRGYQTSYSISAIDHDVAGNDSAHSDTVSGTTPAVPTPENGNCNGSSGNTLTFNWDDSDSGVNYDYNFNGQGWADNGHSSSFSKSGLNYATSYGITVRAKDDSGHTSGNYSFNCTTAANPQFQVEHTGACQTRGNGCERVSLRIINFPNGGSAQCYAGGVNAPDWGPQTYTAGSDGTSPWNGVASQGQLFDSSGSRFADGTFNLGQDAGGVTCR